MLPAAAGKIGTLHVWQKHCITESRTNPINILSLSVFMRCRFIQINTEINHHKN